jgi:hypothetical protein
MLKNRITPTISEAEGAGLGARTGVGDLDKTDGDSDELECPEGASLPVNILGDAEGVFDLTGGIGSKGGTGTVESVSGQAQY